MRKTAVSLWLLGAVLFSGVLAAEVSAQRQAEITYMLLQDCGSCHGMRLTGGLGPALTPERFQKWTEEQLAATILYGRPGTPMPPWRPFLTEPEARWLARTLKKGVDRP
jgi:cytochrome c55X